MDYGDRDGHGRHGILDDDGERILCHECGRRFLAMASHLRIHGMTAEDYRAAHGLSPAAALASAVTRTRMRETSTRTYYSRPDIREFLADGRALAVASGRGSRVAAEEAAQRRELAAVRHASSTRTTRTNAARGGRERARLEQAAQEAGYGSLRAWLIAHRALSDREIAARLGVSRSRGGALRLEAAGPQRKSPEERVEAVASVLGGSPIGAVARQAGVSRDTLRAWVQKARQERHTAELAPGRAHPPARTGSPHRSAP